MGKGLALSTGLKITAKLASKGMLAVDSLVSVTSLQAALANVNLS